MIFVNPKLSLVTGSKVTSAGTKQISVVTFDSTVRKEIDFSVSSKGARYLKDKIMAIKHRRGTTATGSALAYVRNQILGKVSILHSTVCLNDFHHSKIKLSIKILFFEKQTLKKIWYAFLC